ncbi:unnamed protein product [Rotaria sordida]|uniref:Uncharacterized protein n=1 Tax=Rotaria sordida TaxID=392033 RepID=A0A813RC38_9BILA|nr:unnamed protein product [Rotaria sordida]CAF1300981.1 unnamed protein product [Rotaria sordida]
MPNKSSKLPTLKRVKKTYPPKKSTTPTSFCSGISSVQYAIQQRLLRSQHSTRTKRDVERITEVAQRSSDLPVYHHPWESEYYKIFTREKYIKPMTKDPYTPMTRSISHAVEDVTTETECCPFLIAAEAVKIETFNIQQAPGRPVPNVIRYLRRTEPMPPVQPALSITPVKIISSSQSQYQKPTISIMDTRKVDGTAPNLVTADRLLNRTKTRNDASVIRRPPRKLDLNVTHETIMPLSVYG